MDTTAKGNSLEDQVYDFFRILIHSGRFFTNPEYSRIYKKKAYFSKDRENNIVFHIAIESSLPAQQLPSLLVLIEYKNYNYKVPVDDVEEFYAKTQQIASANSKSILVSSNSYQDGAINFARSKGIGLVRYFKPEELDWVLTRSPENSFLYSYAGSESAMAYRSLTTQEFMSRWCDFYGYVDDVYTNSPLDFFCQLIKPRKIPALAELIVPVPISQIKEDEPYRVPYIEKNI